MMRAVLCCALAALSASLGGCGDSVSAHSGANEPLIVQNGQFFEGSFPASHDGGPQVTQLGIKNTQFAAGTVGKVITGDAATSAQSVALALQGLSHGYWVLPLSSPDLTTADMLTWSATCDFSRELPVGMLPLRVAASDDTGQFGPATLQPLSITSFVSTGHVVASLTWGSNADLDIHIQGPSGKDLNPKHPNSAPLVDAGVDAGTPLPGSGLLDRDSNAGCVLDNYRTEDVVWSGDPEVGTYAVRVDMFSACGAPAANFTFSLYVDGQRVLQKSGRLLDTDADGGGDYAGLFVTEFNCEGTGTCS
jgi:hypothetical protein